MITRNLLFLNKISDIPKELFATEIAIIFTREYQRIKFKRQSQSDDWLCRFLTTYIKGS